MSQVLIFEQDGQSSKKLARILTRAGISVCRAATEFEVRKHLRHSTPDVICLDTEAGGGEGFAAVTAWRKQNPDSPIVVMTGNDDVINRTWAERINASAFLTRPFSRSRFCELIQRLLKQSKNEVDRRQPGPSIMMYSHDTIGLGHMRRNSAIASNITSSIQDASVLMLVGSPTGVFFELAPGVDFVKLPSLSKVGRDKWLPGSLRIAPAIARDIRANLIENTVRTYRPDVFLVDHEPAGVWDELVPLLQALRNLPSPPRIVLGLRDILDDPKKTRAAWRRRNITELIRDCYDDVLVYGNREFFASDALYGLSDLKPGRVHYCGLVSAMERSSSSAETARSGIVVAGGGGRDAAPMFKAVLDGLAVIQPCERPLVTLIAGPLMDRDVQLELSETAAELGATLLPSVNDMARRLQSAALFVSMGGYNSLTEALATRVPTLVIPRTGPSSEQRIRAERMATTGLMRTLSLSQARPDALAQIFQDPQSCKGPSEHRLSLDGATNAAEFIGLIVSEDAASNLTGSMLEAANA